MNQIIYCLAETSVNIVYSLYHFNIILGLALQSGDFLIVPSISNYYAFFTFS